MEKNPKAVGLDEHLDELDRNRERTEKEIATLDNRHLASKSMNTKDKPLCSRCGGVLHGKTHGYCDDCKKLRDAGEIPALERATPDFAQRQCKCGNWFEPTTARGSKCKSCKDNKGEPMTKTVNSRRRYSVPAKALFVKKVNELREKGKTITDACIEAGRIALGRDGNGFSYDKWSQELDIPKYDKTEKAKPPLRAGNKIVSPYTLEQRAAFLDAVDAEIKKGTSKGKACRKIGKELLGSPREVWHYRDYAKAVRGNTGVKGKMGGHRKRAHTGPVSPYPEADRRRFVAMVDDMRSRGIKTDVAAMKAGREVLGVEITGKKFSNWKGALKAKDEKANGTAAQKAKTKLAADLDLAAVKLWLANINDATELVELQAALSKQKAIVKKEVETQATHLLDLLEKLGGDTPVSDEPQPEAGSTASDVSTGQEQSPDSGE